jgi:hypothetical protein
MGDLSGVRVGDELLLIESYNRYRPEPRVVAVEKVGRKLIHADRRTYRIEDGSRNDNYGHTSLRTREQHAEIQEEQRLREGLRGHGITFGLGNAPSIPRLRALLAVMEAEE